MAKKGDIVRFLNDVGGGRISRIEGNIAYVEDEDGFETPVTTREIVVVQTAESVAASKPAPTPVNINPPRPSAPAPAKPAAPAVQPAEPQLDLSETTDGNVLNVVLGFEPIDVKRLTESGYEMSLVNDSNYYLYYCISAVSDIRNGNDTAARLLHAGLVEPNIQVTLGQYNATEAGSLERLQVQLMAMKRDRDYQPLAPIWTEVRMDTTKFFKLHCFKPSTYFDGPALAFDIVRNGEPVGSLLDKPYDAKADMLQKVEKRQAHAEREMRRKANADLRAKRTQRRVSKPKYTPGPTVVIDLHIDNLVDTTAGMSAADMLNLQVDIFRGVMDENLRNHGQKIIFIHGKGEGVLRQALEKELRHRYKEHNFCDASFAEYGYGATQVTIR